MSFVLLLVAPLFRVMASYLTRSRFSEPACILNLEILRASRAPMSGERRYKSNATHLDSVWDINSLDESSGSATGSKVETANAVSRGRANKTPSAGLWGLGNWHDQHPIEDRACRDLSGVLII